jgi:hypothetical protein
MEDHRQSLRPAIVVEHPAATAPERFQNEVLRPILKMQHALLGAIFRQFMVRRKLRFQEMPRSEQLRQIERSLQQDTHLRHQLLGAVIGQFTLAEYEAFLQQEAEATRRIVTMLVERLRSQAAEL